MEATQVCSNRWMNKDAAHVETEILHSCKKKGERQNEILPFAAMWMEL